MNFQTPSKKIQNHLPQPKTQSQMRLEQTHQKMARNVEDDKETASKPNQYVCSKDRKIRKLCFSSIQVNRGRILDWFLEVGKAIGSVFNYLIPWLEITITLISKIFILLGLCASSPALNTPMFSLSGLPKLLAKYVINGLANYKYLRLILQGSSIERYTIYHYLIEEFQDCEHHLICEALQWMAIAWTNLEAVLSKFGVQTYKQLARKIMCYISRGLEPEFLLFVLHQNEKKWGTTSCAWRRYSHKIYL